MDPEFYEMVFELLSTGSDSDMECAIAARKHGFDPDDAWRVMCRVTAMVEDRAELRFAEDEIRMAKALRRRLKK